MVRCAVRDTGSGIPVEDMPHLFEPFWQVDDTTTRRELMGVGLGLSIVKHVCHNHGGSVDVWSREGMGTTFTLRLPSAQQVTSSHAGAVALNSDDPLDLAVPISAVSINAASKAQPARST